MYLGYKKNIFIKFDTCVWLGKESPAGVVTRNCYRTRNIETRVESKVAGFFVFLHIRMIGYFRLGQRVPQARK